LLLRIPVLYYPVCEVRFFLYFVQFSSYFSRMIILYFVTLSRLGLEVILYYSIFNCPPVLLLWLLF
jgi:hypothetical protein